MRCTYLVAVDDVRAVERLGLRSLPERFVDGPVVNTKGTALSQNPVPQTKL